jgi:hypothetical protein
MLSRFAPIITMIEQRYVRMLHRLIPFRQRRWRYGKQSKRTIVRILSLASSADHDNAQHTAASGPALDLCSRIDVAGSQSFSRRSG